MTLLISGGNTSAEEAFFTINENTYVAGGVWGMGDNEFGMFGNSDNVNHSSPVQVGDLETWVKHMTSRANFHGIKSDGKLWVTGRGSLGNTGLGNVVDYSSPVQVGSLTNWAGKIGGSSHHTLVIKTDGTLWAFGYGGNGQLGKGNVIAYSSPVQVGSLSDWDRVTRGGSDQISMAIRGGKLYCWGLNNEGQLGTGNLLNYSSPIQIGSLTDWLKVSHGQDEGHAIKTDGTLWGWGRNDKGTVGDGTTVTRSSPVQIGSDTNWLYLSGSTYHFHAMKQDGTLWGMGQGAAGKIGVGNTTSYSSPVQIGSLTTWRWHSSSSAHSGGIDSAGRLWRWGSNNQGQLGIGNTTYKSSPVQVGSLTSWLPNYSIGAAGGDSGMAMRS